MPRGAELSLLAVLTAAAPLRAADWLAGAEKAAREAALPGSAPQEAPRSAWKGYVPESRLFSAEIPSEGWWPMEEESARGVVVRLLGPDSPSGALRATLTVRFFDKDTPGFVPIKQAVEAMRRSDSSVGRSATPVRPLRVSLGLARSFELVETRRLPSEQGPSFDEELHHYVAVIPVGEAYYLVRLLSARATYLDHREMFVRFLKSMRATVGR